MANKESYSLQKRPGFGLIQRKGAVLLRILHIPLEFNTWENASHFPYNVNYGFEEGFTANGVEFTTIPAIYEYTSSDPRSWLYHIKELCSGKRYDQAWLEVVHTVYDEKFLEWLSALCPVRIGLVWESSEMHPDEYKTNPAGAERRRSNLARNLQYMTHIIAGDERDVASFNSSGVVQAKWLWDACCQPLSTIDFHPGEPRHPYGLFYGALYGERRKWLEHSALEGLLVRPQASPEHSTELPGLFDRLNAATSQVLREQKPLPPGFLEQYTHSVRTIRRSADSLWLKGLKEGVATVNLPQFGKTYAGRVIEGMAAGRPVITWEIPDRPRTRELFENGREILLYDQNSPEQLAEHIKRLLREPELGKKIADNARRKLLARHNTEELVRQVLIWTEARKPQTSSRPGLDHPPVTKPDDFCEELISRGLWTPGAPLRLHLGCGEQHFEGYVNIDYPPDKHSVMNTRADIHADILNLDFPPGSVDEIRLHHVFEHFSRVTALALLIRWREWLKAGGKLVIETPDLIGSARALLSSNSSWSIKMGAVRHLVGDQSSGWAYHVDQWFPERFERTLSGLGFGNVQTSSVNWPHEPFLSNVTVQAVKTGEVSRAELVASAEAILWESTVAPAERPTFEVWKHQLHEILNGAPPQGTVAENIVPRAEKVLAKNRASLPLDDIHDFNQRSRDRWMAEKAAQIAAGASVLDIGAGTCPYRDLFSHCDYKAHDFKRYEGEKLGGTSEYGNIDIISDICAIPVPDASFDAVVCTEVLEHVPEPTSALREMARILKPGGRILISAPLGSGLHQLPFHFYGGFTPNWYNHFLPLCGIKVTKIAPNGGFFRLLAQESHRAASLLRNNGHFNHDREAILALLDEWLPRFLFDREEQQFVDQFTVGYHVEGVRDDPVAAVQDQIETDPQDARLYVKAARLLFEEGRSELAFKYLEDARELDPAVPGLAELLKERRV